MTEGPTRRVLLTNDDGIESVGLRATYDALSGIPGVEVTTVAPADDQSAVGRRLSTRVEVREHDLGYAVEGTPADCVVAGLESLLPDTDIVVAGCNKGANLGEYVLGRSGTVSAAVEAAFFDVPAISISMYVPPTVDPETDWRDTATDSALYENATRAAAYLVDHAVDAGVYDQVDYLNVNAPVADGDHAPMAVTFPSETYDMRATREGDRIHLDDLVWKHLREGTIDEPKGSDRWAVMRGVVSVSPLTAPHTTEHHEALDGLAETYQD